MNNNGQRIVPWGIIHRILENTIQHSNLFSFGVVDLFEFVEVILIYIEKWIIVWVVCSY